MNFRVKWRRWTGAVVAWLAAFAATEVNGQGPSRTASFRLLAPIDYQVCQRFSRAAGRLEVLVKPSDPVFLPSRVETRLSGLGQTGRWRSLRVAPFADGGFRGFLIAPAGGWRRLEVRVEAADGAFSTQAVEHVGVGEVFVIAGQSNSANHGEQRQQTQTGMVAAMFDGHWQLANDPQPGATGGGGSFIPAFGDALAARFHVPIGIIATGVGATSVREWLPRGARFPNPPTLTGNVRPLPGGDWESTGSLFDRFTGRIKPLGPYGFRAVLWHQGESDANQRDARCTLPGELYAKYLTQVIADSRREIVWQAPWFVAQASYHTPDDPASPDIRAAQSRLWASGVALEGPDTDALTGHWREDGGRGVHFSAEGLREHGRRWADKVAPWLQRRLGDH